MYHGTQQIHKIIPHLDCVPWYTSGCRFRYHGTKNEALRYFLYKNEYKMAHRLTLLMNQRKQYKLECGTEHIYLPKTSFLTIEIFTNYLEYFSHGAL